MVDLSFYVERRVGGQWIRIGSWDDNVYRYTNSKDALRMCSSLNKQFRGVHHRVAQVVNKTTYLYEDVNG